MLWFLGEVAMEVCEISFFENCLDNSEQSYNFAVLNTIIR